MDQSEIRRKLRIWTRMSKDEATMRVAGELVKEVIENLEKKLKGKEQTEIK